RRRSQAAQALAKGSDSHQQYPGGGEELPDQEEQLIEGELRLRHGVALLRFTRLREERCRVRWVGSGREGNHGAVLAELRPTGDQWGMRPGRRGATRGGPATTASSARVWNSGAPPRARGFAVALPRPGDPEKGGSCCFCTRQWHASIGREGGRRRRNGAGRPR